MRITTESVIQINTAQLIVSLFFILYYILYCYYLPQYTHSYLSIPTVIELNNVSPHLSEDRNVCVGVCGSSGFQLAVGTILSDLPHMWGPDFVVGTFLGPHNKNARNVL